MQCSSDAASCNANSAAALTSLISLCCSQAGDVVEAHAAYLPPPDAQALCSWALRLLQLYSAHNLVGSGEH